MAARQQLVARVIRRTIALAATAAVAASLVLPLGSRAENGGQRGGARSAQAGAPDSTRPAMSRSEAAAAERHIAALRARLHVTAAQEPLWLPLAAAMRDSVAALDRVYAERGRDYDRMSAVTDLKSYSEVQQTNADNVKSLITPFERLYDSFSAAQKRQADAAFRSFTDNAVKVSR